MPDRGPIKGMKDPAPGYKESTKTWRVRSERTGQITANTQTEHWSGRIDAVVRPKPLRFPGGVQQGIGGEGPKITDAMRRAINGIPTKEG